MKNTDLMNIHSIYGATEGEGTQIGSPQIFIRFQGCSVGCKNCDSRETWSFAPAQLMRLEDIHAKLAQWPKIKRASITGGDPLNPRLRDQTETLCHDLSQKNYWLNIEASGNVVDHKIFSMVNYISFDFKTPSTGVATRLENVSAVLKEYSSKVQIKSVIESKIDFEYVYNSYLTLDPQLQKDVTWVLTPAYNTGEELNAERIMQIYQWNMEIGGVFKVIVQQHKIIFGSKRLDV